MKSTSRARTVPIGRPIANTQVYILNQYLQPVPIGVIGELYVGGDGVGRGYHNRPELTQEKFILNPFSKKTNERLYKTGDLARYLPDGNIEYVGRCDHQVKIRGFRIELAEIEATLVSHPQVQEALAIVWQTPSELEQLVAYVVSKKSCLEESQLRQFLKQKLPDYMVPSSFIMLKEMPLTPNGKINRRALPSPSHSTKQGGEFIPPRNVVELQLAQIWSEVLDVDRIGIRDNFFDLGGHSLLAVRLMTKIGQKFQKTLPLATLFQSPTIEQLASLLQAPIIVSTGSPLIPIQPQGSLPPLFCIHPGGGHVFCYVEMAGQLSPTRPVYGLQAFGLESDRQPLTSVEEMADEYIKAIRQVQPQEPYYLVGWCSGGIIAFEMAQQLLASGYQVASLVLIDSYPPTAVDRNEDIDRDMLMAMLIEELSGLYGKELAIALEELYQLDPLDQLNLLLEKVQQLGILPSDMEIQQAQRLWNVFCTNFMACRHYQLKTYPAKALLICASENNQCKVQDSNSGWNTIINHLKTCTIPGNHYTIVQTPLVKNLIQALEMVLETPQEK
ncbi:alpha/beta fold hydrolase (plasmid) [Nostoc sp. C052]|uniref:non-ribosomal peptide synthetase n=1 Tax=Nostoc sp. C052 TaxID=2576902 RepID=UPI0015C3B284|nr:non-ribosomal peptide synthetase [Nostoc sp. C052]QLE45886.1 alpha/beta fold hydrolase [Nostoc sp. C052]